MKKMKLSLLAIALMVATAASAQVSFGIQGGVNLSNMLSVDTPQPKVGFNVGILTDIGFSHNAGIRTGLFFTTKGFRESNALIDGMPPDEDGNRPPHNPTFPKVNLMYLQIPVHFAYKVDVSPGTRIVFHGGPYVAYGIRGSEIINGNRVDSNLFGSESWYNPFDFGLGIGVGFEFGRILTGIGWDMGLLNIDNKACRPARTQNAYLTVGFRF